MGGFGSGFWRLRKRAVENCLGLRLVSVSRTVIALYCTNSGFVVWSITREWKDEKVKGIHRLLRSISIKYATVFDSQWRTVTQDFQLQASVPNFNGRRWWFRCQCGRKVGRLYLPPNERYFACRHCHALNYRSSQQEDKRAQALKKNRRALREALRNPKKCRLALKALGVWENLRTALVDSIPELLAFARMSPEEHLVSAEWLLFRPPTYETIAKAEEHLKAIPLGVIARERVLYVWHKAQALKARLKKRQ